MNKSLEATIIASAHDIEIFFKESGVISTSLDYAKQNKNECRALNNYLNQHFSFHTVDSLYDVAMDSKLPQQLEFDLDGFEVLLNGDIQFYLSTKIQNPINQFHIKFDLLMDKFPEQQNKLTFRFRNKKLTHNYLTTNRIQLIKLEP